MKSRYIDSTGNEINRSTYESFLAKDILEHHEHWGDIFDKFNKKLVELIEYNKDNYSFNSSFDGAIHVLNYAYPGVTREQIIKYLSTSIASKTSKNPTTDNKDEKKNEISDEYPNRMALCIYKFIFERALPRAWILPKSHLLEGKDNTEKQTYTPVLSSKESMVRPGHLFSYQGRGRVDNYGGESTTRNIGILSAGGTPKELKNILKNPTHAGRLAVRRIPQSPTIILLEEHDLPFGAGPSGTLGFALNGLRALFGNEITDLELRKFYMALTASLVYDGHHSFADVGILIDALHGKDSSAYKVDPKLRAKEYYDQYLTEDYRHSDSYHKFYTTRTVAKYSAMTWEIIRDALVELKESRGYYNDSPNLFFDDLNKFSDSNKDKFDELSPSDLNDLKDLLKKHLPKPGEKKETKAEATEGKPTVLGKLVKKLEDSGITLFPKNMIDWTTVHQLLKGASYDEEKNPALSELILFNQANAYKKSELSDRYLTQLIQILMKARQTAKNSAEEQILKAFQTKLTDSGINLDDLNAKNIAGYTPVMQAVIQGEKELIKTLLDAKANPAITTEDGFNLLHLAALKGSSVALLKTLLSYPELKFDVKSSHGDTPLLLAIQHKRSALIPSLLAARADVNMANSLGETPLYIAAKNGDESLTSTLLELKASVNAKVTNGTDALGIAIKNGHKTIAENILKIGGNIDQLNKDGVTPLWEAVQNRDVKLAKTLIELKANPNFINKDGQSLFQASMRTYSNEISEALAKIVDATQVDNNGNTPLHLAVIQSRSGFITPLLEAKANINAENKEGMTVLHLVTQGNDPDLVSQLLKSGANVNLENKLGETPLMLAMKVEASSWSSYSQERKYSQIEKLIEAKANLGLADKKGLTALNHSINKSDERGINSLLKAKSNINQTDSEGNTPLHLAAEKGLTQIVKLLVENKADMNAKRVDGKTPVEFTSHLATISYLKETSQKQAQDQKSAEQLGQAGVFSGPKEDKDVAGKALEQAPDAGKKLS